MIASDENIVMVSIEGLSSNGRSPRAKLIAISAISSNAISLRIMKCKLWNLTNILELILVNRMI